MNGNLGTLSRYKFNQRVYILNGLGAETINVEVVADPHKRSKGALGGVVWDWLQLQPLVQNLPPSGEPIRPDVYLTTLKPIKAVCRRQAISLIPGKLTSGEKLNVRDWQFEEGYGTPTGSEITYRLDASWKTFVAVIGLADGWKGAGPYQIVADNKILWTSEKIYGRNDPGKQISVPIPPGHKTIMLRIRGSEGAGAWAHAGFMK